MTPHQLDQLATYTRYAGIKFDFAIGNMAYCMSGGHIVILAWCPKTGVWYAV